MKIKKLITLAAMTVMTGSVWGQTDETSTYIKNADFSADDALTVHLCGYGADISKSGNKLDGNNAVYGAQKVTEWTDNDIKNSTGSGAGGAGGIFTYGSQPQLKGNSKAAPADNPAGESTGKALGIFAVWGGTIQYTQEVTLPAAVYTLTFTYYNQSGTSVDTNLFGFETSEKNYYGSTKSFATGAWKTETISFELEAETTGKISVGYKSPNTAGSGNCPMLFVDNVKLVAFTKVGKAKADLKSLIDEFTVPETNVGDDAFQYPTQGIEDINAKLQAAQAVYDKDDATLDDINEQIEKVEALTLPALNGPKENVRYKICVTADDFGSYIVKDHPITFVAGGQGTKDKFDTKNYDGYYSLTYEKAYDKNYGQAFRFIPVEGEKDMYKISFTGEDGETCYMATQKVAGYKDLKVERIRVTEDIDKALKFKVVATSERGVWNLLNTESASQTPIGVNDYGVYTRTNRPGFAIAEAEQTQATLKVVKGVKYGTFIAPFKAEKPENVTLYSVEEVDGTTLTLAEAAEIAANTPYIVYADAEETISKTLEAYGTATKDSYQAGLLVGTLAGGEMTLGAGCYLLQKHDDVVGFYQCEADKSYKLGANRAYLKYEALGGVKAFFFGDENNETAITALSDLMNGKAEIYDLNGRKLQKLEKGVNIVNGKKVIIK